MSLNKWCGIGRMVKDPNLRRTQRGQRGVAFTIAGGRHMRDQDGAGGGVIMCHI